ncbi:MAG TPA: tetratricopeptide repeat protein, partial [Aquabacterium sp.]|nr:tetratricopeptide repeat protein [Aquabacterium sp.]
RPGQLMSNLDLLIHKEPENLETRLARAHALLDQADYVKALQDYAFILSREPHHASALAGQGLAQQKSGQIEAAMKSYRQSLQIQPDQVAVLVNLGGMLRDAGQAVEALPLCERATLLAATQPQAWMNLGNACLDLGRLAAARESFARVCALQPENPDAQWALGWAALLDGEWALGLPQLEWRWKKTSFTSPNRNFSQPQWRGEDLSGKTILLHAEQGLGDTLQFCRYAPRLVAAGARVLLEVQAPLSGLLKRLHPEVTVLVAGASALPSFDFHCPLMSLPMAMGERPDRMTASTPYLTADEMHVQHWQRQLSLQLDPQTGPRVGLVWSGNAAHSNDRWRSMPLSTLLSALPKGMHYVCLQKDVRDDDVRLLAAHSHIIRPAIQTFEDTAALAAQMDVVITVDTSVAHLAAAMGRPTWILLPQVPDWRWLMERTDTPWYPSARLFRQHQWGQWDEPLSAVQQALRDLKRS